MTSFDEGTGEDLEKSKGRGDQPFNPDWTYPVRRELSMCTRASLVRMHATTSSYLTTSGQIYYIYIKH